jgi:hypothetical protein
VGKSTADTLIKKLVPRVEALTKTKTVTSRWPSGVKDGASFVIPTME